MRTHQRTLERVSDQYLAPTPDRSVDQKILGFVGDYVVERLPKSNGHVLELGVGDQVWTPRLLAKYPHLTTVDGTASLLDAMKLKLKGTEAASRWHPVVSMFESFSPTERFDIVLVTFVLEHVDDADAVIKRARQHWLAAEGLLAVVVPHAMSLHRRLAVHMGLARYPAELGESDRKLGHTHCFTYTEMERSIVDAGFKIREKRGMFAKSLPNALLIACSDAQLKGLFDLGLELPIEYAATIYFLAEAA